MRWQCGADLVWPQIRIGAAVPARLSSRRSALRSQSVYRTSESRPCTCVPPYTISHTGSTPPAHPMHTIRQAVRLRLLNAAAAYARYAAEHCFSASAPNGSATSQFSNADGSACSAKAETDPRGPAHAMRRARRRTVHSRRGAVRRSERGGVGRACMAATKPVWPYSSNDVSSASYVRHCLAEQTAL